MYAKRWVSFALAAVMAAGILAGCDSQQGGDGSSSSSSSSSSQVSGGGSGGSGGDHSSGGSSHETAKSYTVTAVFMNNRQAFGASHFFTSNADIV